MLTALQSDKGYLLPMKKILAQLTANNQVLIRYTNRPNCLSPKSQSDLTAQKETEVLGRYQQKIEDLAAIITRGCKEYDHLNYSYVDVSRLASVGTSISAFPPRTEAFNVVPVRLPACRLDGVIEYYDTDELRVKKSTYRLLSSARKSLLDIISKSQHPPKKHSTWGQKQSIKRFTSSAKQKILEAGAVIDKHVGVSNSYELTLTVPGSGWDVYNVVSRWSGWIVNRMTQVVRRLGKKGIPCYWFFVWEHQKRGALHQHWCIAIPDEPMLCDWVCRQLRAKWFDLLEELSVKTGIDLFKKRGLSGTWRNSPGVWQSSITPVRKSVAAYFSKYCSKNVRTSDYNNRRRAYQTSKNVVGDNKNDKCGVASLCPSRYWGSSSRVKRLCDYYRVTICFDLADSREGDFICKTIRGWLSIVSDKLTEVSRRFKAVAPDTGFVYCSGWEQRIWFEANVMNRIHAMFQRIHASARLHGCNEGITSDSLGLILDLDGF